MSYHCTASCHGRLSTEASLRDSIKKKRKENAVIQQCSHLIFFVFAYHPLIRPEAHLASANFAKRSVSSRTWQGAVYRDIIMNC